MGTAHSEQIVRCVLLSAVSVSACLQLAIAETIETQEAVPPVMSLPASNGTAAQLYDERYAAENYWEAAEAAKRLISDVIAQGGDDLEYADALEKLARAQRMSGELTAAIDNFRSAAERVESAEGMLAARLLTPLKGLAGTLAQNQEYRGAVVNYQRAAHISRVNEGPMNLAQCEILAELVNLHVDQSLFEEAIDFQAYQLTIYRRSLEETDPRVLAAWQRSGELLSLSGDHLNAREHYVFAMDNIRVADGPDSLAQLPFLYDLSKSYLHHANADIFTRIEMARAELERAVLITERNTDATPRQRFEAYLRMGDFMQRFGQWKSALINYRLAWHQTGEDEELRRATFDEPELLNPPPLPNNVSIAGHPDATPPITVLYDIDHRGQIDNIRVQDDPPSGTAAKKALKLARKFVFRPRFVAGDPVATPDVVRGISVPR
jgi:tetratricopeptide (TPR) repeat protein